MRSGVNQSVKQVSDFFSRIVRSWALPKSSPALPVDMFRICVGLLAIGWNARNLQELSDISSPDGLLDHELVLEMFWFARLSLFQPGLSESFFCGVFVLAMGLGLMLTLGFFSRTCTFLLYLLAVSTYRWNLPVMYVDDAMIHTSLFWLMLMPQGQTLTWLGWRQHRKKCWQAWSQVRVPVLAIRAFLANIALLYFMTGIWKWTSEFWRSGFALYPALKIPLSFAPEFWQPEHLPILKILAWSTMVLEPLLALMFILKPGHKLKYVLLVCGLGLHLGIMLTLNIPFANLACLAALILAFRHEIMSAFFGKARDDLGHTDLKMPWRERLAKIAIVLIVLASMRGVPIVGPIHKPAYAGLWCMGLVQEFRLFDWIEGVNSHVVYDVRERIDGQPPRIVDHGALFPMHTRSVLLQAYLHNLVWLPVPRDRLRDFKKATFRRYARRYARERASDGLVTVGATRQRVTPDNMQLNRGTQELLLMFTMRDGSIKIERENLGRFRIGNSDTIRNPRKK